MRVTIIGIDRSQTALVRDKTLGYRGQFESPVVSGTATFVPYAGREGHLVPGASISVETAQEGISAFSICPSGSAVGMKALPIEGDYEVVGTVTLNSENEVFYIDVGDCSFAVDAAESGGVIPREGDVVRFMVHGLSLWDENI